ncbi:hypothetical protein C2S52_005740 [Perilla frutescens var. hirtella]|nr:hypothetical protein C2S52_005740 [Perilla frutescens var. hirtella]
MEEEVPLLPESKGRRSLAGEVKKVSSIAFPMMVVTISQYLVRAAPMFMLGHLGELSLSGASISTSLCNATGFTVVFGMASALETLCGQAFGAEQYQRLGTYTCASVASLFLVCIPISLLWIYAEKLLILIGQDPLISAEAGKYSLMLIPALFASAFLESLVRFLQTQHLIIPMLCSSLVSLCIELPLCWVFTFKFDLGVAGGALSVVISSWFNVLSLLLYVKYSPACDRTLILTPFSRVVFVAAKDFFRIAAPSALMFCLEGWTYELIILLSGLLPNPQLETSVVTMCYMIAGLHSYIPYSFGAAASTLVSNELGAGKPEAARFSVYAVLAVATTEFVIAGIVVYLCRGVLGYAFSEEKEVVDYIEEMVPLVCITIIMDSIQNVLSGVVRGGGWQHIGAYVNLGAYYLVGVPVALVMGFVLQLKVKGLFSGVAAGASVQALSLSLITALTDWDKQSLIPSN